MPLEKRKYKDGDHVLVAYQNWHMIVVSATECLKDWNYKLAFPKKDGSINKRMSHRYFWQTDLSDFEPPKTTPPTADDLDQKVEGITDYKQIAFKLQDDIKTLKWEAAQKELPFLREMKNRLVKYRDKKDITQLEMVMEMIGHWIDELEKV